MTRVLLNSELSNDHPRLQDELVLLMLELDDNERFLDVFHGQASNVVLFQNKCSSSDVNESGICISHDLFQGVGPSGM